MSTAEATCTCGCATMPQVTNAEEACGCGCACCAQAPQSTDDEIRQLQELRQSIDRRLSELEKR